MNPRFFLILAVCVTATLAGCSKQVRPGSKVTGKVTFNGNPVVGAKIIFTDGKDLGSSPNGPSAITDSRGEYAVIGVAPGSYKVVVYKLVAKEGAVLPPEGEGMDLEQIEASGLGIHALPKNYASPATTTLVVQVPEGKHKEDFELK